MKEGGQNNRQDQEDHSTTVRPAKKGEPYQGLFRFTWRDRGAM